MPAADVRELREIVLCSLERWDSIWRRNQFLTDLLLSRNPDLRVLFVEPPADPLHDLVNGRKPSAGHRRRIKVREGLLVIQPLKPLPRRFGAMSDAALHRQVLQGARRVGFTRPVLWINDVTYAPLIARTGWPSLYDVTDDWLLYPFAPRELDRLRRLDAIAVSDAEEVVVCSRSLAATRGASRSVRLIPNGVDLEHFRRRQPRPSDLPEAPTAVYVGTLDDSRLDVELLEDVARAIPHLQVVLLGPDGLSDKSRRTLRMFSTIHVLGPRPYEIVPAYLQHADVVIVPHLVTPFTDSLDPIKAYECMAIAKPVVATRIAGFRNLERFINVVDRASFVRTVATILDDEDCPPRSVDLPEEITWDVRSALFEEALRATL